jgi:hypothetical protein
MSETAAERLERAEKFRQLMAAQKGREDPALRAADDRDPDLYWMRERADDLGIPWEAAQTWQDTIRFLAANLDETEMPRLRRGSEKIRKQGGMRDERH